MKFFTIILILTLAPLLSLQAQSHSGFSLGLSTNYSPELQFYEDSFSNSRSFNLHASYFDKDYTRMEYSFQYSRGFDSSVSYVAGLSAAVVIQLSDQLRLKPGVGIQEFKMADRSCRTTLRTVLDSIFDISDTCSDDVHASFTGFTNLEYQLTEPFSFFIQTTYRTFLSSVGHETGGGSETDHSFYSSGFSLGGGFRVYFW